MRTIVLFVDVQRDFMLPDGKLPVPGAMEIVSNLSAILGKAREKNVRCIWTADWHSPRDPELAGPPFSAVEPDYKTTFPLHCMAMTDGAMILPEVAPINPMVLERSGWPSEDIFTQPGDVVILKNRFSLFTGNPFATNFLRQRIPSFGNVIVCGVASNVCVDLAIRGLLTTLNISKIYVPFDGVRGINCDSPKLYAEWRDLGVNVGSTQEILDLLEQS